MAEFCNKCTEELRGDDALPEIDILRDFETLAKGECISGYLCEGCGIISIMRNDDDQLLVVRMVTNEDETVTVSQWEPY